jgi:hypothetical protein
MDPFRIFIGWDSRFTEPAEVLAHSIRRRTLIPIEINYLNNAALQQRHNFNRLPDPKASTEFTYSRFLVPFLCGYSGRALFLDNDMLCLGDVAELAQLDMTGCALRVVQHNYSPPEGIKMYGAAQQPYPRKLWSSLMLMDCSQLRCWTKEVVETASGARLHRFQDISDAQLGGIDPVWNEVHKLTPATKLFHWTEGGPWYEQYRDCPYADVWLNARKAWLAANDRPVDTPLPTISS